MRMKSASMEKPEDKDPGGGARQTEHHVTVVICQWRQGGRHVQRLRAIRLVVCGGGTRSRRPEDWGLSIAAAQ